MEYKSFLGSRGKQNEQPLEDGPGRTHPKSLAVVQCEEQVLHCWFSESLSPAPEISKPLIGRELAVYGPTGYIQGFLLDITDYDLILDLKSGCKTDPQWGWMTIMKRRVAAVDRSAIVWMREIEND